MTTKTATKQKRVGPGRLSAEEMEAAAGAASWTPPSSSFPRMGSRGHDDGPDRESRQGASTKTIYARYANKLDILKAVIKRIVDRTVDGHKRAGPFDPATTEPRKFLITLCTQVSLRIATEAAPLNRMAISEGHRLPELRRLHMQSTMTGAGHIRQGLDAWRSKGSCLRSSPRTLNAPPSCA